MKRIGAVLTIGLGMLALGACADDGPWSKPNVSSDQLAMDQAACRRAATAEAERDLVLTEERGAGARDSRTRAYTANMNRFSAGRNRDELYAACMARLGYTRGPRNDPKSRFEAESAPQAEPEAPPAPR
jgi:hypothetical protein